MTDDIAKSSSCDAAVFVFFALINAYYKEWCRTDATYETLIDWVHELKTRSVASIAPAWVGNSAEFDSWFEQTCRPAIETSLSSFEKKFVERAPRLELQRIQVRQHRGTGLTEAKETLGQRIRRLRDERGWTQDALCDRLGLETEKSTVSTWESDRRRPNSKNRARLAAAFDLTVEQFLEGTASRIRD